MFPASHWALPEFQRWEASAPSPTKRIDGVIAAVIALHQLVLLPAKVHRKRVSAKVWTPTGFIEALPQEAQT